jgi:hypothetical protein
MADLGIIVTGAVAVAGIGGTITATWMTGKSQARNLQLSIGAENRRAMLADKRRTYASFHTSLDRIMILAGEQVPASKPEIDRHMSKLDKALTTMYSAASEVVLIAPVEIGALAHVTAREFGRGAKDALRPEGGGVDVDSAKRERLYDLMRAELAELETQPPEH